MTKVYEEPTVDVVSSVTSHQNSSNAIITTPTATPSTSHHGLPSISNHQQQHSPPISEKSHNISIVSLVDDDDESVMSSLASDTDSDDSDDNVANSRYVVEAVKHSANIVPQNGTVIMTQAIQESSTSNPKIGSIAVQNSSDITFGNKTFYQGPVTIKQFLLDGNNRWVERDGPTNSGFSRSNDNIVEDIESNGTSKPTPEKPVTPEPNFKTFIGNNKRILLILVMSVTVTAILLGVFALLNVWGHHHDDSDSFTTISSFTGQPNNPDTPISVLRIVHRAEWVAQPPTHELDKLVVPVNKVVITHTATAECFKQSDCVLHVRQIQMFHIESFKFFDIGYNFLVGGDGQVYEGRGWDAEGSHTKGYNKGFLGIALIGTFSTKKPSRRQFETLQLLLDEGVRLNKIKTQYILFPHRCFMSSDSPGNGTISTLLSWPHYYVTMLPQFKCPYDV